VDAGIFEIGAKVLQSYVPSLPQGFLIQRHNPIKPPIKGTENGFVFYTDRYEYISAIFNLNYDFGDEDPKTCFYRQCEVMMSTLSYLNKRDLKPYEVGTIVKHIFSKGNYIFNVDALYGHLIAYQPNDGDIVLKSTNKDVIGRKNYNTMQQYRNDLNKTLKLVNIKYNFNNIFDYLHERIYNNDYAFMKNDYLIGHRSHNKLSYLIIAKFNLLVTGRIRSERYGVKKYPINNIYSLLIKSLSYKPQQQNAFIQKGIIKYEKQLKDLNRLVNNRPKAQQLVFILGEILEKQPDVDIVPNVEVIEELKAELYSTTKDACLLQGQRK
jgi:hypothetical protein